MSTGSINRPGVLVVDDEAAVRTIWERGLHCYGFDVWPAADGREALDIFQRHQERIAGALLDVRMPGLDGPQMLAALEVIAPTIRCCFMTRDSGCHASGEVLERGAFTVLSKPFRLAEVASVLWRFVSDGALPAE
jgi:CheY-like chemotaxis protein